MIQNIQEELNMSSICLGIFNGVKNTWFDKYVQTFI